MKRAGSEDRRKNSHNSMARKANRTSNFASSSVEIMKDETKSDSMEIVALRSKVNDLESQVETANYKLANLSRHILNRNSSLKRLAENFMACENTSSCSKKMNSTTIKTNKKLRVKHVSGALKKNPSVKKQPASPAIF